MFGRSLALSPQNYGPWAIVTGASSGIGRACAEQLAARGFSLLLVARRRERLEAFGTELEAAYGVQAQAVPADLSQSEEVFRVLRTSEALDVGLFVGAAGYGLSGEFVDGGLESELGMIDLNCRALAHMSHAYGRRFREQGRGGLILISSLVSFQGTPRSANYAATKAYVQSLAEALAHELRPHGVQVLACAPGPVATEFGERADMKLGRALDPGRVAQETLDALGRRDVVRPGFMTKFLLASLAFLPRSLRVRILGLVMKSMTAHQLRERPTSA
ncbi:MAG: SDR family oxidoreductase [Myxococcota bacterium]